MNTNKDYLEFINNIKKVSQNRNHKVTNSYGIYHAYKYYRKNKPKEKDYILTESQYFSIIRKINEHLKDSLIEGNDINLPSGLGKLELRKYNPKIYLDKKTNTLKNNLPIDWDKTYKLWYEDEKCFKDKILIRIEEKELFKIYYNKKRANYNNKVFYEFKANRELKKRLKNNIKRGNIDAFNIK